jgi:glycosyltransferase involved in cell wall biosynthesis
VYRAFCPEPQEQVIRFLKKFIGSRTNAVASASDESLSDTPTPASSNLRQSAIKALLSEMKSAFDTFVRKNLLIPDDWLLWIPPAVLKGKEICAKHEINVIFSTAPPFSDLLVGYFLKRITGLPWVTDYRDLWTGDVLRDWVPQWRRRLEINIERWAVSKADAVVAVSEPKTASLRERVFHLPARRFFTITNGYDPEEYDGLSKPPETSTAIRFVYTGRLFKNRRGYELIEALGKLHQERPELRGSFRVEYWGGVSSEIMARLRELIRKYSLEDHIHFFDDVPYAQAKQKQVSADVLLLIVDTGETTDGVIPGKLFEYVAAKRPILCIAAPGATPDIIERGRLGWVTPPGDIQALREVLEHILSGSYLTSFAPDAPYLEQFERKRQIELLAQIFNGVVTA